MAQCSGSELNHWISRFSVSPVAVERWLRRLHALDSQTKHVRGEAMGSMHLHELGQRRLTLGG
jgi:hypothetical protein